MVSLRPRVLFVLPSIVLGGAEIRLLNMLNQFQQIEGMLLTHQSLLNHCPESIVALPFENYSGCTNPYPFDWKNACVYARAVAQAGNQLKAQMVFGWMHHGAIFTALAGTLFGLKSRLTGSVLGPASEHYRLHKISPSYYERILLAFTFQRLHGLVVPSDGTGQDLIDHYYVPACRVQRIYNGVDPSRVMAMAEQGVPEVHSRTPFVLAASRLSLEKGFDVQLRAFARVRQAIGAQFFILGDGPMRTQIEAWIAELGLSADVRLLGFQDNPFVWMKRASAFLMASRLEGFGNALVEAMSLGLPVVSTACPYGPIEIIEHDKNGLLSPVDDDEALANNLLSVLSDNECATRLSTGARARATAFTMSTMIENYERFVLACLK